MYNAKLRSLYCVVLNVKLSLLRKRACASGNIFGKNFFLYLLKNNYKLMVLTWFIYLTKCEWRKICMIEY